MATKRPEGDPRTGQFWEDMWNHYNTGIDEVL